MDSHIEDYNKIVDIRTKLKQIQQISWDMAAIEKRYPLNQLQDKDLPMLLEIYEGLLERLKTTTK